MNKAKYAKKQTRKSSRKSRWWIWLIVIILIGGAAGGAYAYKKSAATNNTTTKSVTGSQPAPVKKELPKEGEVSDIKFQVKGVSVAKTYGEKELTKAKASGTFKIIKIAITNNQKSPIDIDSSLFKLKDSQGREFAGSNEAQTASIGDGKESLLLKKINPGVTVEGDLVFDVPADAKELKLIARGGMGGKDIELKVD